MDEKDIIQEENKVEETKEIVEEKAEEKVEETPSNESAYISVEKPDPNEEPYYKVIEDRRSILFKEYTKSRRISNIITICILLIAIGAMILITQRNMVCTIIGWSLAGATVIGLIIYYLVNKNKFPNKTREYIKVLTQKLNENTFEDEKFTDVKTDPNEKMDASDLLGDAVYANIGNASSRNLVRGKYNDKEFYYAECALIKAGATKKEGPMFVGKYISFPNNLEMKGRIIITLKKKEDAVDLPTQIGDIDVLKQEDTMVVYGMKDANYERILGGQFLKNISRLTPNVHLLNVNMVVWAGKTGLYLSYDDAVMALPFDKPFDKEANDFLKSNLMDAFELMDKIGK